MKKFLVMTAVATILASAGAWAQEETAPTPPPHGGPRGEKMFERLDADKDGSVSKEEFLKVQEEHFAKMDANGDGKFTQDEARSMKDKMREMRQKMREEKAGEAPAEEPAAEKPAETPAEKPAE